VKINVIATGSSGNLYEILDNFGNSLIIEAGVPRDTYMKYREGIKPPEMCIVSHAHSDHAERIGQFRALMPTFLSEEKNESKSFKAMGFPMNHGGVKCYSFLIKLLVEDKFLFFATDFQYSDDYTALYRALQFYKVENYLIECNYNDYLYHMADKEQRVGCDNHLSDNGLIKFMQKAGAKFPKIITIHGSNRLCADVYTKKYLSSKIAGSKVYIATGAKGGVKNIFLI